MQSSFVSLRRLQGFKSADSSLRWSKGRHSALFWGLLPLVHSDTSSENVIFGLALQTVSSMDSLKVTSFLGDHL